MSSPGGLWLRRPQEKMNARRRRRMRMTIIGVVTRVIIHSRLQNFGSGQGNQGVTARKALRQWVATGLAAFCWGPEAEPLEESGAKPQTLFQNLRNFSLLFH